MARVLVKDLTKRYGDVVAVDRLNLEVKDKEFVVLLGPSGCGKTTTLRTIAGLEDVTEGEIYIGDRLVNDLDPKQRNVAMVFQSYALYPHMTVFKNMAFPLENARLRKQEIARLVKETAKLLQIENLLDRKPSQLSGGQRQRVALGRAIVREPTVFLMDEPLSNLDAKLRVHMRAELKRLQKDIGVTTIYVTHDQVEAMTMADRVALMDRGLLQQHAAPQEVYSRPANVFVAGFVGSPPINMFDCDLADDGVLDAGEFRIPLPQAYGELISRSGAREFTLAIRPQDVVVHRQPPEGDVGIETELYTTEPLGDVVILDLKVGDRLMKVVVSPDFDIEGTTRLWVQFPERKIHLFDRKTGWVLH